MKTLSYVEAVLDNRWDVLKTHIEKLAAQKIIEKLDKKKVEVLEILNKK